MRVAPHVGAWIETHYKSVESIVKLSLPMWERGLKLFGEAKRTTRQVAPHVGAWIETICSLHSTKTQPVAPHVGAWIETH